MFTHFDTKPRKAKANFHFYKYTGIILAAATTIVSSLQVYLYSNFSSIELPVLSAGATVTVGFLGAQAHNEYGSIPEQQGNS